MSDRSITALAAGKTRQCSHGHGCYEQALYVLSYAHNSSWNGRQTRYACTAHARAFVNAHMDIGHGLPVPKIAEGLL